MKVGIISPTMSLRDYCTTGVQYCIPSLIVESKEYRNFYKEREKDDYLILDTCKVGWKREPEAFPIIKEALKYIDPSIIITPSYMYDLKKTLEVAIEFLKEFRPKFVAGCIEGTRAQEIQLCTRAFKKLGVSTLAIPSHIFKYLKAAANHNGPTIYLDNHLRVEELDELEGCLVTSLPVRLGLQGRLLSDYLPSPPSLTFCEEDKFPEVIKRNIRETLEFYKDL